MIRKLLSRFRRSASHAAWSVPAPLLRMALPAPDRDYRHCWVDLAGVEYRRRCFERQSAQGTRPLIGNPSLDEVRNALRSSKARSVLEVGCGWGRLLGALTPEFEVAGCDVSDDMLRLCPPELKAFRHDIAIENLAFNREHHGRWHCLFTRGVMLYLMQPEQTAYAMNNMLMLASGDIHIWEWPEICQHMQLFSTSSRFIYHPIEHRDE